MDHEPTGLGFLLGADANLGPGGAAGHGHKLAADLPRGEGDGGEGDQGAGQDLGEGQGLHHDDGDLEEEAFVGLKGEVNR